MVKQSTVGQISPDIYAYLITWISSPNRPWFIPACSPCIEVLRNFFSTLLKQSHSHTGNNAF